MNEINKIIDNIQDNSRNMLKLINRETYKILDLENQPFFRNSRCLNYVQESILDFEFNITERKLFRELQNTIETTAKSSASKTAQEIEEELTEQFRNLKKYNNIDIDYDFRHLTERIVQKFSVSYDELYSYFRQKQGRIINMIQEQNQNAINAFIKMAPSLANMIKNTHSLEEKRNKIVNGCRSIVKNLESAFMDPKNTDKKPEIANTVRSIQNFLIQLDNGVYDPLIKDNMSASEIETFIREQVPRVDEILKSLEPKEKDLNEILLGKQNTSTSYIIPEGSSVTIIKSPIKLNAETQTDISPIEPIKNTNPTNESQPTREQVLNNFIETFCSDFLTELDKIDPKFLETCEVKPTDEFIIDSAVSSIGYITEEELNKVVKKLNKQILEKRINRIV